MTRYIGTVKGVPVEGAEERVSMAPALLDAFEACEIAGVDTSLADILIVDDANRCPHCGSSAPRSDSGQCQRCGLFGEDDLDALADRMLGVIEGWQIDPGGDNEGGDKDGEYKIRKLFRFMFQEVV